MLQLWLNRLLALLIAATPAAAQEYNVFLPFNVFARAPSLTRGTCVSDTTDTTTYNSVGFQSTGTGANDSEDVVVVIGVAAEDNSTAFSCSSMTIDGAAATEIVDEDGTGAVNTCFYRTSGTVTNAAQVNVSVTFSEALTGAATVCGWALKDLDSATPTSSVADDDTASAALVLTLPGTTSNGFGLGICTNVGAADATAWTVLTEQEDTQHADGDYSTADAATTGQAMAATCDWTGTNDASGAAVAFGDGPAFVQISSSTSTGIATIVAPATIEAGDLLVLADWVRDCDSGCNVPPTGWTEIADPDMSATVNDFVVSYKIADGTEDGATITGQDDTGSGDEAKVIVQFRHIPTALTSITTSSLNQVGGIADPTPQSVTASGGTTPLIVIGAYGTNSAVDPRTFTIGGAAAKDGEVSAAANDNAVVAWKITNSGAASDVSVDMDDEGTNALVSFYITRP